MIHPFKWFRGKSQAQPILKVTEAEELQAVVSQVSTPPPPQPKGKVTRHTKRPEYTPGFRRGGGRIVKVMPRELLKIKEAQEKIEDDES